MLPHSPACPPGNRRPICTAGRVAAGSDAVIEALPLDAVGEVPWWPPEMRTVTLGRILAHTTAETYRHAGHADIVRELIDGAAGLARDGGMLPDGDRTWWERYRARLEEAAGGKRHHLELSPEYDLGSPTSHRVCRRYGRAEPVPDRAARS